MKMETVLPAPFAARVKELLVSTGSQVETGAPLVRLEPLGDPDAAAEEVPDEVVDLDLPETDSGDAGPAEKAERSRADL
jgi:pyruvate/2-oxoglutarate dehydrogenase complex dihydrolipoamide acyltransferase (E2) component